MPTQAETRSSTSNRDNRLIKQVVADEAITYILDLSTLKHEGNIN